MKIRNGYLYIKEDTGHGAIKLDKITFMYDNSQGRVRVQTIDGSYIIEEDIKVSEIMDLIEENEEDTRKRNKINRRK